MLGEKTPKERGDEEISKEFPKCKNCGRVFFSLVHNYCPQCGYKLMLLPRDLKGLYEKENLENLHDQEGKEKSHENLSNSTKYAFCPFCGEGLHKK